MELTDSSRTVPDNAWEFSEFDWTLDYTAMIPGIDWLSGSVGAIYYRFPNQIYRPDNRNLRRLEPAQSSFDAVI